MINQNIQLHQSNNNQINNYNNLNHQLNDEKIKNQKLEFEIQKLKNEYNINIQNQMYQNNELNTFTFLKLFLGRS